MNTKIVDITPDPKILSVLGEIEFKPWQCIAELVDNSVDGFLRMERAGAPIDTPTVQVAFGRDTVTVKDNGPGMSLDALENAVKAGWTSNDRFGSLGLYGVGFNIATARLGTLTTIWTTQAGDDIWYGLEIDLQKLKNFKIEVKTRSKSDALLSGTEVEVKKIKPDWKDLIVNSSWLRSHITDRLSSIYGTMLRDANPQPIKFSLYVNNKKVSAWEHCTWPMDWEKYRKEEGFVRPIQEIDITFGEKYASQSTGEMYDTKEEYMREGVDASDIVVMPERVYGWIGIQRYADEKEYGIDILRNGRKIEVLCKDLFDWEQPDGETRHEYPIDDPRQRGRIVGELHLDHGYVHYTKHRFEREHSSWKQLLKAVRHDEPFTLRERLGYPGVNASPLGVLFRTFRRNSPSSGQKWEDILFIRDNEKAKGWAKEYRKGNLQYRDDQRWLEELKSNDNTQKEDPSSKDSTEKDPKKDFILGPSGQVANTTKGNGSTTKSSIVKDFTYTPTSNLGYVSSNEIPRESVLNDEKPESLRTMDNPVSIGTSPSSNNIRGTEEVPSQTKRSDMIDNPLNRRTPISELSFHISGVGISGKSYDVEVFAEDPYPGSSARSAWSGRLTERNVYEIIVNLQHPAFNSTSLQVRDAVLAQIAYLITYEESESTVGRNIVNYGDILVELRRRYATTDSLDTNYLRMEINGLRERVTKSLSKVLTEEQQKNLLKQLLRSDAQRIELNRAMGPKNTPIVMYFEMKHLAILLEQQPETFFEDKAYCFNKSWTPSTLAHDILLLDEHRKRLVRDLSMLMRETGQFMDDLTSSPEQNKSYLALVRACVNRMREYLVD